MYDQWNEFHVLFLGNDVPNTNMNNTDEPDLLFLNVKSKANDGKAEFFFINKFHLW